MDTKERHDRRVHLIAPFALFDPLLAGAAVVVEGNDAFGRPRQVSDDKTTASARLFPSSADTNLLMWPNGRIAHHPATRRTIGLRLWLVWRAKFLLGFRVRLTHRWREMDSNPRSLSRMSRLCRGRVNCRDGRTGQSGKA